MNGSTLVKRVKRLGTISIALDPHWPEFKEEFCVICGLPRFSPGPTGITCGGSRCLQEIGRIFERPKGEDLFDALKEIVETLDIDLKNLTDDKTDLIALCKTIKEKCEEIMGQIKTTKENLRIAANLFGLDLTDLPSEPAKLSGNLVKTTSKLSNDINTTREQLILAAEYLDMNRNEISNDICNFSKAIAYGVFQLRNEIKKLEQAKF